MKQFVQLFLKLDGTTSTNQKKLLMIEYFKTASAEDLAWATYFLTGQKLNRLISSKKIKEWCLEMLHVPLWLYDECYVAVGDTSETISLLLPERTDSTYFMPTSLSQVMNEIILRLERADESEQKRQVLEIWNQITPTETLVFNKLITGGFRIGVSRLLAERALADWLNVTPSVISHRLMGRWYPSAEFVTSLTSEISSADATSQPYPFYLASPIEGTVESLGPIEDWTLEWKWDGIRAQVINRDKVYLWSRGEESLHTQFPELVKAASLLPPGTVLDGEIVAWKDNQVLPFAALQKRIMRKKVTAAIMTEVPIKFIAFDCLETNGTDVRAQGLEKRREALALLVKNNPLMMISENHNLKSWPEASTLRETSRGRAVEGLMLKRKNSDYQSGRKRGSWYKWKINPLTIDAVLLYAQAGHGKRANLFTDYTFAVWNNDQLVPVAKAYSGLDDREITELDKWIRAHTKDKFGPVRSVEPHFVFELGFEGVSASPRHKSGVALRFPRILRWRRDKKLADANSLKELQELVPRV